MKNSMTIAVVLLTVAFSCKQAPESGSVDVNKDQAPENATEDISPAFAIEILDEEALTVIDPGAEIEVMASGFTWTEGPLWIEEGEYLLFSDIPNNRVYKLTAMGDTSTYLYPSGKSGETSGYREPGSNGLLLSPAGELVLMQHGDRRVAKMTAPLTSPKAEYAALGDNYQGKRLNSPNDGAFDTAGNLYFTDPPYGLPKGMNDPGKELDFQGVYFIPAGGEVQLLDSISRPNGLALSPDGKKMYVAVSDSKHAVWYEYDIESPGVVRNKKIFFEVTGLMGKEGQQGAPDGLKVNNEGYLFATGPGGVWIFNAEGKPLARIYTGQRTANCALAYDETRLFMTADDYILSVDLK